MNGWETTGDRQQQGDAGHEAGDILVPPAAGKQTKLTWPDRAGWGWGLGGGGPFNGFILFLIILFSKAFLLPV